MTELQEQKKEQQNLIPKPVQDAFYAGCFLAGSSFVLGVPSEHIWKAAIAGATFSFGLHWNRSAKLAFQDSRQRRRKARKVPFNNHNGTRNIDIDMEFSIKQGGYIRRETYLQAIVRKFRKPEPITRASSAVKPQALSEFVFHSHYDGYLIELQEKHVKLFLSSAWHERNRKYGKGLSERRWVRHYSQRPAWYKELPCPIWYYGMRQLIIDTQHTLKRQMVVETGNNWYQMAHEPRVFYSLLKWYETERRNNENKR